MYDGRVGGTALAPGAQMAVEPVAAEICKFAAALADRADLLAQRINGKLSCVATSSLPTCESGGISKNGREYPPLFAELRERFVSLECSLNHIEDTIARTEL